MASVLIEGTRNVVIRGPWRICPVGEGGLFEGVALVLRIVRVRRSSRSHGWALKRGVSPYDVPAIRLNDRLVVLVSYEETSSAERERERFRTSIKELDRE